MSTALLAARPAPVVDRLGSALVDRGLTTVPVEPSALHRETPSPDDLRVAVWVAPNVLPDGEELFSAGRWDTALAEHLEDAFRVLRAAATGMQRLDPVDGERGVVVLVAAGGDSTSLAHDTALEALSGMTFAAARDLADLRVRVVALVRDHRDDEGAVALVLQVLDNPMLNGLTLGARGRAPGGW